MPKTRPGTDRHEFGALEDASGKMQAKAPGGSFGPTIPRSRHKQYVQPDLEADRRVANTLAGGASF